MTTAGNSTHRQPEAAGFVFQEAETQPHRPDRRDAQPSEEISGTGETMKILTYIGTFAELSDDQIRAIGNHGGFPIRSTPGKWQVEFYRPISPATAIRMMDDILGREKLIQQVTGDIPIPDDAKLGLEDGELTMSTPDDPRTERQLQSEPLDLLAAADKLRAIADDLQARSGVAEITVTITAEPTLNCAWCDKPAKGSAYAVSDHTYPNPSCGEHGYDFTPDEPKIPAAAVGHPDNVPHDGVGPGEVSPRDPLDAIMVELQAADSATMQHEYVRHLQRIAEIVRVAREQR